MYRERDVYMCVYIYIYMYRERVLVDEALVDAVSVPEHLAGKIGRRQK